MAKDRDTHPFISYGDSKNDFDDLDPLISEEINRIIDPIFNKVLQETQKTPILGRGEGRGEVKIVFWNPHNYRLYFDFDKSNFDYDLFIKPSLLSVGIKGNLYKAEKINSGSEFFIQDLMNCNFRIKKKTIEIQSFLDHNRFYAINLSNIDKIREQIISIEKKKRLELINNLKRLIQIGGGSSKFIILKRVAEDKVQNEYFIDKIPDKMRFETKHVKKVYYDHNVEFKNVFQVINYLETSSLNKFYPELTKILKSLAGQISEVTPVRSLSHYYQISEISLISGLIASDYVNIESFHNKTINILEKIKGLRKGLNSLKSELRYKKNLLEVL